MMLSIFKKKKQKFKLRLIRIHFGDQDKPYHVQILLKSGYWSTFFASDSLEAAHAFLGQIENGKRDVEGNFLIKELKI